MSPQKTRLIFMGTSEFSAHILEALIKANYNVIVVFTQPPRPVGRGYKITPSPVHKLALNYQLPVLTPTSLKSEEVDAQWKSLNSDIAVVAAYGLLLPKSILEGPKWGCLNVHASLLPRWRGAAPIQRAILAGDTLTGISIMKMEEGLDTGDILLQKTTEITPETTTSSLQDTLAHLGVEALLEALPLYLEGNLLPVPQNQEGILYAEKLSKKEGLLDWSLPAHVLERKIRALNPWPGTWFTIGEDHIKILKAEIVPLPSPSAPGTILDSQLTIACGQDALRPLYVQKKGKSPMSVEAFLHGYELPTSSLSYASA